MMKLLCKHYAEYANAMINDFTDEMVFNLELIGEEEHTIEGIVAFIPKLIKHEDTHHAIHDALGEDNYFIDDEFLVHALAPIHWNEESM